MSGFLFHWQRVIELPAKELEYAFWDFETETSGAEKAEVVAVLAAAISRSQDSGSKVDAERFSLVEKLQTDLQLSEKDVIPRLFFSLYSMLGLLRATGDWRVILSEFLFDDAERLKISG